MACKRLADDLRAHAAGADATPDLRAHLEGCGDCRQRLARERSLVAAIDRDLASALRLEPSAEFNARVRERISAQQAPGWWLPGWRFALGAGSLVLVAVVVATTLRTGTPRRHVPPPVVPSANTQVSIAPAERLDALVVREAPVTDMADHRASRHRPAWNRPSALSSAVARTHEPEVLVPPDQRMAIGRLLEMLRTGKIDEHAFPSPAQENAAAAAAQVVPPIVVEELKVPPIIVAAAGSTEKRESR